MWFPQAARRHRTMAKNKRDKTVRRWCLEIDGERFRFSSKQMAVVIGRQARRLHEGVRLIEEYDLFATEGVLGGPMQNIDHQEFDRTILLA